MLGLDGWLDVSVEGAFVFRAGGYARSSSVAYALLESMIFLEKPKQRGHVSSEASTFGNSGQAEERIRVYTG